MNVHERSQGRAPTARTAGVVALVLGMVMGGCATAPSEGESQPTPTPTPAGSGVARGSARASRLPDTGRPVQESERAREIVGQLRQRFDAGAAGESSLLFPREATPLSRIEPSGDAPKLKARVMRPAQGGARYAMALYPMQASGETEVRELDLGKVAAIGVRLRGASAAAATVADGHVVYEKGVGDAHVLSRPLLDGTEDSVAFDKAPAKPEVVYEVALKSEIAGLRLVAETLEMLDASGTPRLRMSPPVAVGSDGARVAAHVSVEGCAVDTSAAPPWGRKVVSPGASTCAVRVSWSPTLRYPAVLDPSWTSTGSMAVHRRDFLLERMSDGRVLAAGGQSDSSTTATAEIYDPTTGTWSTTASMPASRKELRGLRLKDGRVLVAGGRTSAGTAVTSTYIYDPTAATWSTSGALGTARRDHTLTLLSSGKVVAAGGYNASSTLLASSERFDPATGAWTSGSSLNVARAGHAAASLHADQHFVSGGTSGSAPLASAEVYDEASNSWNWATYPNVARHSHTLTHISESKLLAVGGTGTSGLLATTEVFSGPTNAWTAGPSIAAGISGHTVTALLDGRALIVGGDTGSAKVATVQSYDSVTGTLTTLASLGTARARHGAVLLGNGRLLVAGGQVASGVTGSAEILSTSVGGAPTGSSKPPLYLSWNTTSGSQASTGNVTVTATNSRDYAVRYHLSLRGVGLDGRDYALDRGTFTVGANAALTHSIPANQLPVQSKVVDSLAEWVAEVVEDGCPLADAGVDATASSDAGRACEPAGAVAHSLPLYHSFSSDYSTVTLRGFRPQAFGVDNNPTSVVAALSSAFPNQEPALDGRVYDGTSYTSLSSLSPLGSAEHVMKDAYELLPGLAQRLADLGVEQPGQLSGPVFCLKWPAHFIDDNRGEAVVAGTSVAASSAQAIVSRRLPDNSIQVVWQGTLDDDGCTRRLDVSANTTYTVTLLTSIVRPSDYGDITVRIGTSASAPVIHGYQRAVTLTSVPITGVTVPFWMLTHESSVAAAVSTMMGHGADDGTRLGAYYQVFADQGCPGGGSACYYDAIYIGMNNSQPQTHDSQWKVVVIHEMGHAVQDFSTGLPSLGSYGDDVASGAPSMCRCEHVKASDDRLHCLQSRETSGEAQVEAYAHFFASKVWSGDSSSECTFPYYKEVLWPTPGDYPGYVRLSPPFSANCATPMLWLDTQCPTGGTGRGVEWDWLNFFHHIHASDVTGALTQAEIFSVYRQACGGQRCSGSVTYAQLVAAAETLFGPFSSKFANFNLSVSAYGADH